MGRDENRRRGRNGREWEGREMGEEGGTGGRIEDSLKEMQVNFTQSLLSLLVPTVRVWGKGRGRRQMGISLAHQPPMLIYIIVQLQNTNMKVWAGA